jgi:hypothetical protein
MQYAPPTTGGSTSALSAEGHGPFAPEDIQQIMADTGYEYQQVCDDIDRTGAKTKEELYPQLYSGAGIQPMNQPPMNPGAMPGGEMAMGTPTDDGATAAAAAAPPADGPAGLSPEALRAMHDAMAPATPMTPGRPQGGKKPAWRKQLQGMET